MLVRSRAPGSRNPPDKIYGAARRMEMNPGATSHSSQPTGLTPLTHDSPAAPRPAGKLLNFLIVGGLPIFALGLSEVISKNFNARIYRVQKVRNALESCATMKFDIILLGVTQPERSGLDLLPDFHKRCPNGRVLIVSLLAEEDFAARALKAGAAGYVLKSSTAEEVVRAIQRVLGGEKYVSQAFAGRFAESFGATTAKPHEALSPREFEVFLRIARGSSVKEIAAQLSLSVKTISTYHIHILDKLNVRNDAELGEYALRHGLIA
jgi:two-component system invasion response regulator UvrY